MEAGKPTAMAPENGYKQQQQQSASQDRYSALKELDELFKSTTMNSKF